jgi:hypothetical protein
MCGRYVTPDEAAMERAYNLTARQWQSWMGEAYRPSFNDHAVAACATGAWAQNCLEFTTTVET